ncbi:MAG: hypothetical protein A3A44_03340 [Candidatus Sungbacteria bacterium RIFCSPLOWO2_01_FULL_60_25]|uniref:Uncharacterized protein n=1 Tax=Candidatus Sungbacteria bacterium RIFCSPLOWO2_01_FULL_60_25 TaxID=1802281 RepID=A0A1G2LDV3_9BACT|nr:MAG: hypothetical protein A3A44_03340 [Candidatus Sungbacteria bacterium RIFCSPLOWO2_01_FULL_60_25]
MREVVTAFAALGLAVAALAVNFFAPDYPDSGAAATDIVRFWATGFAADVLWAGSIIFAGIAAWMMLRHRRGRPTGRRKKNQARLR